MEAKEDTQTHKQNELYILDVMLHCHHQNDFHIEVGSDVSHCNV